MRAAVNRHVKSLIEVPVYYKRLAQTSAVQQSCIAYDLADIVCRALKLHCVVSIIFSTNCFVNEGLKTETSVKCKVSQKLHFTHDYYHNLMKVGLNRFIAGLLDESNIINLVFLIN